MKNDSGGTAFLIFWIIIIIIGAIVIGLNKITDSDYGLAIIVFPIIAVIAIVLYRGYRKDRNKKAYEARQKGEKYNKPTVIDDAKTGVSVVVVVIIIGFVLIIIYAILHWFAPGIFPSTNVN